MLDMSPNFTVVFALSDIFLSYLPVGSYINNAALKSMMILILSLGTPSQLWH